MRKRTEVTYRTQGCATSIVGGSVLTDARATALAAAQTRFGWNLFRELAAEETMHNIVLSPLSISTALLMTCHGAGGTTREAIAHALELPGVRLDTLNRDCANWLASLEQVDDHVTLLLGNSLWMKDTFAALVKAPFLEAVATAFAAEVFTRDFTDPQTLTEINGWRARPVLVSTEFSTFLQKQQDSVITRRNELP